MIINFYYYNGYTNVLNKTLVDAVPIECNFVVNTTMLNSELRVTFAQDTAPQFLNYNYCSFEVDGTIYYSFIDVANIRNIGKGLFIIPITLDLLMQYKDDILNSTAIIERSSSAYNMYLRDDFYNAYGYPQIGCKQFPSGFSENYTYLLNVCTSLEGV